MNLSVQEGDYNIEDSLNKLSYVNMYRPFGNESLINESKEQE